MSGFNKAGYNRGGLHFRVYEERNVDLLNFSPRVFVRRITYDIEREMVAATIIRKLEAREAKQNGRIEVAIKRLGRAAI